jgi:hypothetical protein
MNVHTVFEMATVALGTPSAPGAPVPTCTESENVSPGGVVGDLSARVPGPATPASPAHAAAAIASSAELVAGASVLHAGVDVPTLRELWRIHDARRQGSPQSFVMPLVVLSDWLARRVSPAVAVTSMSALLSHDAHDEDFSALRRDVERDIVRGKVPDLAARARTEAFVGSPHARKRPSP